MSSKILYDQIYETYIDSIKNGNINKDIFLSSDEKDNRRGISLIIPIAINKNLYSSFIRDFRNIDADQYYYPSSDLHITIFTFISAKDTYTKDEKLEKEFSIIAEHALKNITRLSILFAGITFSKEAGFINGYDNDVLITLRDNMRKEMKEKRLKIDERYKSETAHVTFMRFKNEIADKERLYSKIVEKKNAFIAEINIDKIELVENDWYNKITNKRTLSTFNLLS